MTPETTEAARRRLRWRARRGLLENDLLLGRFLDRHCETLDAAQAAALELLLQLPDIELLDLLLARRDLASPLDTPAVRSLLAALRDDSLTSNPITNPADQEEPR